MRLILVLPCAIALTGLAGCQEKAVTKQRVIATVDQVSADDDLRGDILPEPVIITEDSANFPESGSSIPIPEVGTTPTTPSGTPTSTPDAQEYCYKATPDVCEIEAAIVRETNKYREAVGVPPLKFSGKMGFVARDWSQTQSSVGRISHNGFPSSRFEAFMKEFGPKPASSVFAMSGENVAMSRKSGQSNEAIGIDIAEQWRRSSGHYKNMISKSYTSIGVGIFILNGKSIYSTQIFGRDANALPPP